MRTKRNVKRVADYKVKTEALYWTLTCAFKFVPTRGVIDIRNGLQI